MSQDIVNAPTARSWRDIPQPVKPRAMSSGGRWRLVASALRATAVTLLVAGLGWGAWLVVDGLRNPTQVAGQSVPLKTPELKSNGVLHGNNEWLVRTLGLPAGVTLDELDHKKLRERLLADGQVLTANFKRGFPDRLFVQITERLPVARLMAELDGVQRPLLVASDGVVFAGEGFEAELVNSLPWLDGIVLKRDAGLLLPIANMEIVSRLLATAILEAEHLHRTWDVISLARLESDRELRVRTRTPFELTIVFSASADFLVQLGRLNSIWEQLPREPQLTGVIDLTFGNRVPVTLNPFVPPATGIGPAGAATLSNFPSLQPNIKREL